MKKAFLFIPTILLGVIGCRQNNQPSEMQFDHILTLQDSTGAVFSYGPADEAKRIAASLMEYLFPNRPEV